MVTNFAYSFGWVNASYVLGYKLMDVHMRRSIDLTTSWEDFIKGPRLAILEDLAGESLATEGDNDTAVE